ncbi:hypothetical protein EIP86_004856 [Pleurotus ostreatoroseus]|nr:hypothetical protein EIP86_004856 [Pleurotus ostreatoroseus]
MPSTKSGSKSTPITTPSHLATGIILPGVAIAERAFPREQGAKPTTSLLCAAAGWGHMVPKTVGRCVGGVVLPSLVAMGHTESEAELTREIQHIKKEGELNSVNQPSDGEGIGRADDDKEDDQEVKDAEGSEQKVNGRIDNASTCSLSTASGGPLQS